jgi:hypothetical protein
MLSFKTKRAQVYPMVVKMDSEELQKEIDQNLEFFEKKLPDLLRDQRNRYALLRHREIVGIYDTIRDAKTTAEKLYSDKLYSIQQVTDASLNLGFYSYADSLGQARQKADIS